MAMRQNGFKSYKVVSKPTCEACGGWPRIYAHKLDFRYYRCSCGHKFKVVLHHGEMSSAKRMSSAYDKAGYIYFARLGDLVKIGYAKNVETRLSQLVASMPFSLEEMARVRGSRITESIIHCVLARHHFKLEWYHLSDDVKAVISWVKDNPSAEEGLLKLTEMCGSLKIDGVGGVLNQCASAIGRLLAEKAYARTEARIQSKVSSWLNRVFVGTECGTQGDCVQSKN